MPPTGPKPAWIQFEFDRVYKLDQMWVWNYNVMFEPTLGYGLKDVTLEYSPDGSTWIVLGDFEFARATGKPSYACNTTIHLGGVAARSVRLIILSNCGGLTPAQYGLSEVRFLYVPTQATEPHPASGSTGVPLDTVLQWQPGREAVQA